MNRSNFYNNDTRNNNYNNSCCNNEQANSCCDERNQCTCCETGPQGEAGGVLNFADFYALMPPDNAATVAPVTDVSFPQDGPISGTDIVRTGPSSFNLAQIGTYQVYFQVSVTEAGQLLPTLNGEDLAYTVAGRATGASQIIGMALVTTTTINSILTVRNPASNAAALSILTDHSL